MPDSRKIGCFTVSLLPFKSAVEDQMHRYSDALLVSLKQSCHQDLKKVKRRFVTARVLKRLRFDSQSRASFQSKRCGVMYECRLKISQTMR